MVVYHYSHFANVQHRKTKVTVTKLNLEFSDCVIFQLILSVFIIQQLFTLLFILTFVHNDCNPPTLRNCVSVPVRLHYLEMTSH